MPSPAVDNSVVGSCLDDIANAVESRYSNQQLSALLTQIAARTPALEYNHTYSLLGIAGSCALVFAAVAFGVGSDNLSGLFLVAAIWLGVSIWLMAHRNHRISTIRSELQDLYQQNLMGIEELDIDPEEKADELASRYFEFQRGDYKREVTSMRSGSASLRTGELPYHLIQFHWVNERIVMRTYTDKDGKQYQKAETVYDHFFRSAILAEIDIAVEVYIYAYGGYSRGVRWKSSSPHFNRIYDVTGESELTVAKLMKPALVLLFEELASEFDDLNFEISPDFTILISFKQQDLLRSDVQVNLTNPAEAASQLLRAGEQPFISRLLSVVDEVNRHSVNELRRPRN